MMLSEANALNTPSLAGVSVFDPQGCVYCAGRGYSGRIALFETMSCNESVSSLIASGVDEHEIWASAQSSRRSSLSDDGIAKLLSGQTTVAEVLSAVMSGCQS